MLLFCVYIMFFILHVRDLVLYFHVLFLHLPVSMFYHIDNDFDFQHSVITRVS